MDRPDIVDVRLERADRPLVLADLPPSVQAAVEAYLAAAETFVPGRDSCTDVELPQLAIAKALLVALALPTIQQLFDRLVWSDAPREPVAVRPRSKGVRQA